MTAPAPERAQRRRCEPRRGRAGCARWPGGRRTEPANDEVAGAAALQITASEVKSSTSVRPPQQVIRRGGSRLMVGRRTAAPDRDLELLLRSRPKRPPGRRAGLALQSEPGGCPSETPRQPERRYRISPGNRLRRGCGLTLTGEVSGKQVHAGAGKFT